jgi:hypothetical protein
MLILIVCVTNWWVCLVCMHACVHVSVCMYVASNKELENPSCWCMDHFKIYHYLRKCLFWWTAVGCKKQFYNLALIPIRTSHNAISQVVLPDRNLNQAACHCWHSFTLGCHPCWFSHGQSSFSNITSGPGSANLPALFCGARFPHLVS